MIDHYCNRQVQLLLQILPEVAKEQNLVLHGGTEINLFIKDMPRLSVDIDMIYTPIENRAESINNINIALNNIRNNLEKILLNIKMQNLQKLRQNDVVKYKNQVNLLQECLNK